MKEMATDFFALQSTPYTWEKPTEMHFYHYSNFALILNKIMYNAYYSLWKGFMFSADYFATAKLFGKFYALEYYESS